MVTMPSNLTRRSARSARCPCCDPVAEFSVAKVKIRERQGFAKVKVKNEKIKVKIMMMNFY
jgi:hypothetical protein